MKVLFIAGFGLIVRDIDENRNLYIDTLGIKFNEEEGGYLHTGELEGSKAFALWPLTQAAQSCFGSDRWPGNLPVPQSWFEFDVEDLVSATLEMKNRGYRLLVENREEPWGQKVTRFLDPNGVLVALTFSPWLRN